MALVKCEECGKEISNRAEACPNCGFPTNNDKDNKVLINEKTKNNKFSVLSGVKYLLINSLKYLKYFFSFSTILCFILLSLTTFIIVNYGVFPWEKDTVFTMISTAMEPTIKYGEIVKTRKRKDYYVNDIIVFKDESFKYFKYTTYVTSRIISKDNGLYVTKVDSEFSTDTIIIRKDQIIGKVVRILPSNKPETIFNSYNTFVILIVILVCLIVADVVVYLLIKAMKKNASFTDDEV